MTAISFANALGVHEQALELRVKRAEIIANNLANADTPGFKARDIDFNAVLNKVTGGGSPGDRLSLVRSSAKHLTGGVGEELIDANVPLLYRQPLQDSIDGNSVDAQYESAQFAKNAVDFAASFRLLNSRFAGLTKAIKGE